MNMCVVRFGIFSVVPLTFDLVQRAIVVKSFSLAFFTHEAFLWILKDVIRQQTVNNVEGVLKGCVYIRV